MEFTSLIFPLAKNICRTCLVESDTNMFMSVQDEIEHEMNKVKIIDILIFLNCLENNDEDNWPQGMCETCVSTALVAYNFKINCLKINSSLAKILTIESSTNLHRSDLDSIDINVVYQDHEYDVPLFNHPSLDLESNLPVNKELTPLPPVTEITSTEQPPRHEREKKYVCTLCNKADISFTRMSGLKYHYMTHHVRLRKFLCPKCGKLFFTSSGLRKHVISHKEVAQFKCGFCYKTYRSRQSLKEHFRVAHSSNRKLHACATCDKRYTAKSSLLVHMKTHNGIKEFACPYCPKTYTRNAYLKAHSLVHIGQEKPKSFLCNYIECDRSYSTKHSLLIHIAHVHSTERPHKCDVCLKGFATPSGLRAHRECHNNNELHCKYCPKRFSNKRVLQKHTKTHDNDASTVNVSN